jgi:hypothetical protein
MVRVSKINQYMQIPEPANSRGFHAITLGRRLDYCNIRNLNTQARKQ